MTARLSSVEDLPHALRDAERVTAAFAGRRPAVFLDYDGVLTPIVDHPDDALISPAMRRVVRELAGRCPVCVVSGRDRPVVQLLMGIDDLVVAGSHGFDIWTPDGGPAEHRVGEEHDDLIAQVTEGLMREIGAIDGVLIEPKLGSVAVHHRLVSEARRPVVAEAVERVLARHPDELKLTPGKMVFEIQPRMDWDKGRAVMHLIATLGLDTPEVVPVFLGDDITDEFAFAALAHHGGVGVFVGRPADPEVAGRPTHAGFTLADPSEVQTFLDGLARD